LKKRYLSKEELLLISELREKGRTYKEIAEELKVNENTVWHWSNPENLKRRLEHLEEREKQRKKGARCEYCQTSENLTQVLEKYNYLIYLCPKCLDLRKKGEIEDYYLKRKRKCHVCNQRIFSKGFEIKINRGGQKELLGITIETDSLRYFHKDYFKSVFTKGEQRAILEIDFSHSCLSVKNEIWIELDSEGNEKGEPFSAIPEVQENLDRLAKRESYQSWKRRVELCPN